jgi:hypothetical protein
MASLHFQVDTSPMALTVDTVKSHVNGVSTAVTAMESAVILAEQEASKTICENVDRGFYILVKSQISQKAVAAYTEMTSKQVTLFQLAKALDGVRRQMQADFNMISRRYFKLFNSLNKSLESRVRELDRPAMKIAEVKKSFVFDKLKDESSLLFSVSGDALSVVQTALGGKLKQKTRDTMQTLYASTEETKLYNEKLESILEPHSSGKAGGGERFLPALFSVTESILNKTEYIENSYVPQSDAWQGTVPAASEINRVGNSLPGGPLGEEEKALIKKEFVRLCEKENAGERVTGEILRLFDGSSWEVLKNGL